MILNNGGIKISSKSIDTNNYKLKEISIEITKECPLDCIHCSSNGGKPLDDELSYKEIKKIVSDGKKLGASVLSISGGEPFINPYFNELIRYGKNKGLKILLYSCGNIYKNGKLKPISDVQLKKLKKYKVDKLIFNLQSHNKNNHEEITNSSGSFDNVINSIKNSIKNGIYTEVHFVPMKINYRDINEEILLLNNLGVNKISILRFVAHGRGGTNKHKLQLNDEEKFELREILNNPIKEKDIGIRFGSPLNCLLLNGGKSCTAGIDKLLVQPNGIISPCVALKNIQKGEIENIREKSLKSIWNSSDIFNEIRNLDISKINGNCVNCNHFDNCEGGCPAQRLINCGDINKEPDPFCLFSNDNAKDIDQKFTNK